MEQRREWGSGELGSHVEEWVRGGILTSEQGEQILHLEHPQVEPSTTRGRLSPLAEILVYLGVVIVVASGAALVNQVWQEIGLAGRVAVGAVVAGVGLFAGAVVRRLDEPGTTRLAWFLWFCGTGGVAMVAAVLADRLGHGHPAVTALWTGAVVAALSASLWRNQDRPLQFLSTVAGAVATVAGAVNALHWTVGPLLGGFLLWTVSVAMAVLGATVLRPRLAGLLLGQAGALMGAMVMMGNQNVLALSLGLATAAAGVTYGVRAHQPPVLGLGVVTLFSMTVRLLAIYLRGPVATMVSLIVGLAMVGVVVARVVKGRHPLR